jgi:nucleoside-diphosphate-sugar epimerase
MVKALVTGGNGFVGRALIDQLHARQESVRALVRNPAQEERLRARGVEVIVGDILDPQAVRQATAGVQVVYHCAAAVGDRFTAREIWNTNLGGVSVLLEAAASAGVGRIILLSSVNVLGSKNLDPATEDLPCRKSHDAAADVKIAAERLALDSAGRSGTEVVILRPGFIYGQGDPHNLPRIITALRRGKFAFIGSRDHVIPIVHVDDVVQAMLLAARAPGIAGQAFLITDGSRTTIGEFVDCLADAVGCARPQKTLPGFLPRLACVFFDAVRLVIPKCPAPITRAGVRFLGTSRYVDIGRARDKLGYVPAVDHRQGLLEVVKALSIATEVASDAVSATARPGGQKERL